MKRSILRCPFLLAYCSFLWISILIALSNYSATSLLYRMAAILHNKGAEKMGKDGIEEMQFKERIRILIRILQMLGFRETLKTIVKFLLFVRTFTFFERFGIHVLPVHWISPIPDTRELRKRFNQWYKED